MASLSATIGNKSNIAKPFAYSAEWTEDAIRSMDINTIKFTR